MQRGTTKGQAWLSRLSTLLGCPRQNKVYEAEYILQTQSVVYICFHVADPGTHLDTAQTQKSFPFIVVHRPCALATVPEQAFQPAEQGLFVDGAAFKLAAGAASSFNTLDKLAYRAGARCRLAKLLEHDATQA